MTADDEQEKLEIDDSFRRLNSHVRKKLHKEILKQERADRAKIYAMLELVIHAEEFYANEEDT